MKHYSDKILLNRKKKKLFKEFCSYSLFNLYELYCGSKSFQNEINEIKSQDGKRIGLLYEFVSLNFSAYYKYSKPHISKIKRINTQNKLSENASQNNNKDELDLDDSKIIEKNII